MGSLVFIRLCIAGNSHRGEQFMLITLEYTRKLKSSQISGKKILLCACIAMFSA